ncbi:type IV pilin protein [Pseudocolwellia agarivorans]|uniref:type IV pilin protein n=1 Tax=Pseudocolwellia agarivorans TaxID=1911682 RepID=UPI003183A82F
MMIKNQIGMTLIELLIAVAIVGILGAVAYPSYVEYVSQSNRSEAQRELLRIANKMEQYFVDTRRYTADMKLLGLPADPFITESGNYSIDTSAQTNTTYTLTATARGAQATRDSDCTTLNISETGQKTAKTTTCWEK